MANFSYLLDHCRGNSTDLLDFKFILELNVDAEKLIHQRISIAMMSLRQGNEEFVKFLARKNHIDLHRQLPDGKTSARSAVELIDEIVEKGNISPHIKECLHTIRQVGNEATHNARYDDFNQAQLQFQNAYEMLQSYFLFHFAPKHFRSKNYEWLEPPQTASTTNENGKDAQKTNHDLVVARLFTQAEIDRKAGRYQEAKAGYKAVLAQDPNHGRSLFQLGMMYEKDRAGADFSKAIECYEKAVASGESYAHASLADCLLMMSTDAEHRERIFELLEKGLSFDNPSNRTYIVYVKIYEKGLLGQAMDLPLALDYAKKAKEAGYPKIDKFITRIEQKMEMEKVCFAEKPYPKGLKTQQEGVDKKRIIIKSKNVSTTEATSISGKAKAVNVVKTKKIVFEKPDTDKLAEELAEKTRLAEEARLKELELKQEEERNKKQAQEQQEAVLASMRANSGTSQKSTQTPTAVVTKKVERDYKLLLDEFGFNLSDKSSIEWIKEAHTHKSAKRYHEAIECFEQGLSQYITTDNHLVLCECYLKVGQYRKAQQLYLKISEENQHSYFHQHAYKMANVGLGDLYFHGLGVEVNPYQALEYYQKANNITKITQAEQAIKNLESK